MVYSGLASLADIKISKNVITSCSQKPDGGSHSAISLTPQYKRISDVEISYNRALDDQVKPTQGRLMTLCGPGGTVENVWGTGNYQKNQIHQKLGLLYWASLAIKRINVSVT